MGKICSLFIAVFTLIFSSAVNAKTSLDGVVVFGDSLSDNGNLYHIKQGTVLGAPYYFGRCSNGLVWVEILTNKLDLPPNRLDDRAIAGAQTDGERPPGVKTQIAHYLTETPNVDPNKLYIIWAGGNNYIYHPYARKKRVQETINDINDSITTLAEHGARYFLIPNLPDIGSTPLAAALQSKHPHLHLQANLTKLSQEHNQTLSADLPTLQAQLGMNVTILVMDDYTMMKAAESDPSKFGLVNATQACYNAPKLFQGGGTVCATPNQYLFWDVVHPTLTGHEQLADLALHVLTDAGLVTDKTSQ